MEFTSENSGIGERPLTGALVNWDTFNSPQWKAAEEYVLKVASLLGLGQKIMVGQSPPPAGMVAYTMASPRFGMMQLSDEFFWLTPEARRTVVVHELMHLLYSDVDSILSRAVAAEMQLNFEEKLEEFIHRMALLLAPSLPLPEWEE
jgi:hypothetical protein